MIKLSHRITLAAISVFGLLNILLIPFSGFKCGLFPEDFEPQFFDRIEYFGDAIEDASIAGFAICYLLPVLIAVACLLMLIASLIGRKGLCIASGLTGIALWFIPFILFVVDGLSEEVDFDIILETAFEPEYGLVAIGTYIALLVFIAYIVMSALAQKAETAYAAPQADPYANYQYQGNYQANNQDGYQYQNNYQNNGYQAPAQPEYATPVAPVTPVNEVPVTPYNNVASTPYTNDDATVVLTNNAPVAEEPSGTDIYANSAVEPEVAEPVATEPVAVPVDESVASSKFCPNCGTKADADAMFCGSCGHKF